MSNHFSFKKDYWRGYYHGLNNMPCKKPDSEAYNQGYNGGVQDQGMSFASEPHEAKLVVRLA